MKVRLISYSKPVDIVGLDNAEDLVAYCARVSNPDNQMSTETSEKLLKYLIRENHWSPFEMVSICMEIETTRDIARQILRHRSFSFQEFSQRYANPKDSLGWTNREARLQDTKNRQNSIETEDKNLHDDWLIKQDKVKLAAIQSYNWAIEMGIAKEQARAVLPEGMMQSRLYMNGTLRSWMHYVDLRSSHGTQKEHIEIAKACGEEISKIFPFAKNWFNPSGQ
jgi:thymidylate synthase (FAD)|tara:strand:+ start:1575 stop:2243 length:669 start_codon:yes stop_codon:yes gene_type:complete